MANKKFFDIRQIRNGPYPCPDYHISVGYHDLEQDPEHRDSNWVECYIAQDEQDANRKFRWMVGQHQWPV